MWPKSTCLTTRKIGLTSCNQSSIKILQLFDLLKHVLVIPSCLEVYFKPKNFVLILVFFFLNRTYRSLNTKTPGESHIPSANLNLAFRLIKDVQKKFKQEEAEKREKEVSQKKEEDYFSPIGAKLITWIKMNKYIKEENWIEMTVLG